MRPAAFPRSRRLKRRRLIRPLFDRGRADVGRVRAGTVVLLYRTVPREATGHDVGAQVGFAPGRRATNTIRTRVRRHLREAFRLHQGPLLDRFGGRPDCLTMMTLYRGRDDGAGEAIRRDLPRALARLAEREIPLAEAIPAPSERPRP
ncbi:ribonuclease P protein component [Rubrivirga marina]|uniref:ribonuclease P protein component n=1 Tax=Rubrivirga marina TaxID=1196024 RepID=UPI001C5290E1|nr:ribonuclease P protein component [Rubrivirga marina]